MERSDGIWMIVVTNHIKSMKMLEKDLTEITYVTGDVFQVKVNMDIIQYLIDKSGETING